MNVYSGIGRRQVGGSLWSTLRRGLPLFFSQALSKFKPIGVKIGESLAKKAASHAMNVGSKILQGSNLKEAVADEGTALKSEAIEKFRGLKRKLAEEGNKFIQGGRGHKRRKISHCKKRKMPKRKAARKGIQNRRGQKKVKKVYKRARKTNRKTKKSTRRGRVTKRRQSVRNKRVKDIFG